MPATVATRPLGKTEAAQPPTRNLHSPAATAKRHQIPYSTITELNTHVNVGFGISAVMTPLESLAPLA